VRVDLVDESAELEGGRLDLVSFNEDITNHTFLFCFRGLQRAEPRAEWEF
jgi:hypothetical protein